MIIIVLACIVSFIPMVGLYFWMRNRKKDPEYRTLCKQALRKGFLTVLPVILFSGVSYFLLRFTKLHVNNPLLYQILYDFVVLALAEEAAKYLMFQKVLKNTEYPYSWADATILMTTVSIGFALMESVAYAIGAGIIVILVRGITLPHAGYGFLEGYFYGKGIKKGKPSLKWVGFVLAWLIHGLYDLSLSDVFEALNDNLVIVPFILVFLNILLVINLIVFVKKGEKKEEYTVPLLQAGTMEANQPEEGNS